MKKFFQHLAMAFGGILLIGLLIWVVMWLWNALVPGITGWQEIGFWQSAGLCLLSRLLTGHIGFSHKETKRNKRRRNGHRYEEICRRWKMGGNNNSLEVKIYDEKENG